MSHGAASARSAEILQRRAEALARPADEACHREAEMVVTVVTVGSERYGLPAPSLREIIRTPRIVPLPGLPRWMRGITAVRGEILSAVDLAGWLGIRSVAELSFLAVVECTQGLAGLMVETVQGLREIHADDIARKEAGVVQATTRDLVSILDLDALVARGEFIIGNEHASAQEARLS